MEELPPPKRPKHFHDAQQLFDPDASTQSLSAAELAAEIDRSHRLAASSKILLRMSAKKNVKGRLSDVGGSSLTIDRGDGQDEVRAHPISKYGETINVEPDGPDEQHSHEHDRDGGGGEVPCGNCYRHEKSMKKMGDRQLRMEMKIDELRADVQGLRELFLERLQPVASSSRSPVRSHENYELEPVPPPQRKQKRRFEEILEQAPNETVIETPVENSVEKPAKQASRRKIPKSAARKREEKRVRQREKREKEREEKRRMEQEQVVEGGLVEGPIVIREKSRKESRKESRKDKSSRTRPPAFVFNTNEIPHFDTHSLSEQIHSLAEPAEPPADPETDTPQLQIPIEKLPHALFLLVSESLPPASRCSLDDLRVLWSGNSTARKVGEWTQIKIPYLHTAMMSAVVGKPTDARVGHRVFTMTDPRWPPTIQIPKLTSSIVAASVGLIKDPLSNTGAFVRDACTICDMQCPDTPLSWRRWLDKGKYDLETLPAMYKTQIQNMCGIPFAAFLRETKKKEKKR